MASSRTLLASMLLLCVGACRNSSEPKVIECDGVSFSALRGQNGVALAALYKPGVTDKHKVGRGKLFVKIKGSDPIPFAKLGPADVLQLRKAEIVEEIKESEETDIECPFTGTSFRFKRSELIKANIRGLEDEFQFCDESGAKTFKLPVKITTISEVLGSENCWIGE